MNVMVHTAINTRGYTIDYLRKEIDILKSNGFCEVNITSPGFDHSFNWLKEAIKNNDMPDYALSHATDYAVVDRDELNNVVSSNAKSYYEKNPLRSELSSFEDTQGNFYPMFIVPIVMFYNKNLIDKNKLTGSWCDILNEEFAVLLPDTDTPITKVVLGYLKKKYPEKYEAFVKRAVYKKSPVEVIQGVATGQYQIGISNISFSMMAKNRNIEINHAIEGAIPLPQVFTWLKSEHSHRTEIADILLNDEIQQYLGEQGFWAVKTGVAVKDQDEKNTFKSTWVNWEVFFRDVTSVK